MSNKPLHSFHIPVMGLAYTVDTPVKVGQYGISSVVSIIEDRLLEDMRKYHCAENGLDYTPINEDNIDARAMRVTAYMNVLNVILAKQIDSLRKEPFTHDSKITMYFELLPEQTPVKLAYKRMLAMPEGDEKLQAQEALRKEVKAGSIDVNIMTKCDKPNYDKKGELLPVEYADAMSALRGYAKSDVSSCLVLSAGLNPRLYAYCESFPDFLPDANGNLKKKIILKVSDYRSALIQGKFFAKKGLWVSEFRVESGLNCGGHAFATDGYLMGPILEEFKTKRHEIIDELFNMCQAALEAKGAQKFSEVPPMRITVQGGIGTAAEDLFLREYYGVDGTGWGSPFLLVPEATNVDEDTLLALTKAKKEDYYLSHASPLGIPFNNLRNSSADVERIERIEKGRPGSPCHNKYLTYNTEFGDRPICTASREYQHKKINQLNAADLDAAQLQAEIDKVTVKECICQCLGTTAFLKNNIAPPFKIKTVSICPGPNLAYFSSISTLRDMVDHIYGRKNVLNNVPRPNMFINELVLYIDYLRKEFNKLAGAENDKLQKSLQGFRSNLLAGVGYYETLADKFVKETAQYRKDFLQQLNELKAEVEDLGVAVTV